LNGFSRVDGFFNIQSYRQGGYGMGMHVADETKVFGHIIWGSRLPLATTKQPGSQLDGNLAIDRW
jgi:hypothetical protein